MSRLPYVELAPSGSRRRPSGRGHAPKADANHASHAAAPRWNRASPVASLLAIAALVLAGCGATPSPTAGATSTPGPSASSASSDAPSGGRIVLDRAPAGLACDAIGVDYRSVTFFIDPTAQPQVWVVTDRGSHLSVRWGPSFVGGSAADPSVLDASGAVVARPHEVLVIPEGAWPSLHGHFVCPSPTALYVLDEAAPR
jgi:hypothetical protein